MGKGRKIRRPTEEAALSRVMREQRLRAKFAADEVLRRVRVGEAVDLELKAAAAKFFLEN